MVLHHLRRRWPLDNDSTRDEVLAMVEKRLKRLPVDAGRERFSRNDEEQDFIERRALVVAQGVRRDLVRDMEAKAARRAERARVRLAKLERA
jgi:hypothetical protein